MSPHAATPPAATNLGGTLRENIAALSERESEENAQAPLSERLARAITAFSGSMTFVALHLAIVVVWIAINSGWFPGPRFDPTFVILASAASVEAIFLSTFVLISQNRMAAMADRRANLDLHISLLSEHELTRLAELLHRVAERLDVPVDGAELSEIEQDVVAGEVLDEIDQHKARGA
jgi:uncharacterized membrane protein